MAISPCVNHIDEQGRELVEHGTALFPVACYHDDLTSDPVPWHWHDELEAVIIEEGTAVFAADHERLFLNAGEGCLVNADVLHAAWNAEGSSCRLHSVVFHPRLVGGAAESIFWQNYVLPIIEHRSFRILRLVPSEQRDAAMLGYIETAWQCCKSEPRGYELQVRSALSDFLLETLDCIPGRETALSAKTRRREERMKQMLEYIRNHLREEMSVAEIARAASISESECIRCFRNTIGVTPIKYVRQLRLQRAAELLKTTDKKIVEIGEECGFQEMSYFSRVFREQFSRTPSQYRIQKGL